jgi:hypothetical protein
MKFRTIWISGWIGLALCAVAEVDFSVNQGYSPGSSLTQHPDWAGHGDLQIVADGVLIPNQVSWKRVFYQQSLKAKSRAEVSVVFSFCPDKGASLGGDAKVLAIELNREAAKDFSGIRVTLCRKKHNPSKYDLELFRNNGSRLYRSSRRGVDELKFNLGADGMSADLKMVLTLTRSESSAVWSAAASLLNLSTGEELLYVDLAETEIDDVAAQAGLYPGINSSESQGATGVSGRLIKKLSMIVD